MFAHTFETRNLFHWRLWRARLIDHWERLEPWGHPGFHWQINLTMKQHRQQQWTGNWKSQVESRWVIWKAMQPSITFSSVWASMNRYMVSLITHIPSLVGEFVLPNQVGHGFVPQIPKIQSLWHQNLNGLEEDCVDLNLKDSERQWSSRSNSE